MDELTPQAADPTPLEPSVPTGEVSEQPADDSLAAHEAAHGPESASDPDATDEARNERGQFKPKRRAQSQRADADDVPAINELTKRLKTIEETHGKDIARKPGESERVYGLRRRAELLERLSTPAAPVAPPISVCPST